MRYGSGYEASLARALQCGLARIVEVTLECDGLDYDGYGRRSYQPRYTIEVSMIGPLECEPGGEITLEDRNRERMAQLQNALSLFVKLTQVVVLAWADSLGLERTANLELE